MRMKSLGAVIGLFVTLLFVNAGSAVAQEAMSGDEIKAIIAGATVEGAMSDGMAYSEFYDADGTIRGDGYTGVWSIEGDTMCFVYGTDPKSCWQVGQNADDIQWLKEGNVEGTGTVSAGNIHNY